MARELLGLHAEEFVPSSPATRLLIAAGALPPASPAVAVPAAEGDCAEPEGGGRASWEDAAVSAPSLRPTALEYAPGSPGGVDVAAWGGAHVESAGAGAGDDGAAPPA